MAKRTFLNGGRRSGWPPERSGHSSHHSIGTDEIVLVVLWAVALAGLLLVAATALWTLFGWDISLFGGNAGASSLTVVSDDAHVRPDSPDRFFAPEITIPSDQQVPAATESGQSGPEVLASLPSAPPALPASPAPGPMVDLSASLYVPFGKVYESSIHSSILSMDLPYRIYLPPGYGESGRRYPVLYLLHGNGQGVYAEWTDAEGIGVTADALIADHKVQPMIIMMPDGEHSYFMNHYADGERWQDYIVDEVVPFVDSHFLTLPEKGQRAIGGLSMGGTGALSIAFSHPELFTAVGAHSPALHWAAEGGPDYFGPDWYYAMYNPLEQAKTFPGLDSLKIWVDYGQDDPWLPEGAPLDPALAARQVDYQWIIYPGDHGGIYWMDHSPDYLRFYSDAFKGPAAGSV